MPWNLVWTKIYEYMISGSAREIKGIIYNEIFAGKIPLKNLLTCTIYRVTSSCKGLVERLKRQQITLSNCSEKDAGEVLYGWFTNPEITKKTWTNLKITKIWIYSRNWTPKLAMKVTRSQGTNSYILWRLNQGLRGCHLYKKSEC